MTALLVVLLLGALDAKIPTDRDLADRIETAIHQQLHPASVQVTLQRRSRLTTTVERLDIAISGFTADSLPMGVGAAPGATEAEPAAKPTVLADDAVAELAFDRPGPRASRRQIRVKAIHLTCADFTVAGLPMLQLDLTLEEARLPLAGLKAGQFSIAAARTATGFVVVREEGLTQFLRTRTLPIADPEVRITRQECRVSGTTRTLVGVPVAVSGRMVSRNAGQLWVEDPQLRVSIVRLPALLSDRLLRDINPLTDLNADLTLPAPLTITRLTQSDGALRVDAALHFPMPEDQ